MQLPSSLSQTVHLKEPVEKLKKVYKHNNTLNNYEICTLIGGTFRSDLASRVMTENITLIKSYRIDLQYLADKLFEKKIINARQKSEVTDGLIRSSADERLDKLLEFLMTSISVDGEDFGIFLETLKEEGTKRCEKLAKKLMDAYNEKLK